MKAKIKGAFLPYIIIVFMAILLALNYHIFIIENEFAPAGINGIATMLQYKTGFSISYATLITNIPLSLVAFFVVSRKYGLRSLVFSLVYSFAYLGLQSFDFDNIIYDAGGHDTIFPVIISGVLSGIVCGVCFKYSSSSGGMETVSKCISAKKPEVNFFIVAFALNFLVAFISLFVYSDKGYLDYKPVALCITYCFILNFVGNYIMKGTKTAYKFTVITSSPDALIADINSVIRHGATKIEASGSFTNAEKTVLLCVVNPHQLNDFKKIIEKYDAFAFCETVNETYGNFKKIKPQK